MVYRPPANSQRGSDYADFLTTSVDQLCMKYPDSPIWIGGDVNIPDIVWTTDTVTGNSDNLNINTKFLNCCLGNGLEQVVDFPTRYENLLDILLTNRPSLIGRVDRIPGVSDHQGVPASSLVKARYRRSVKHKVCLWNRSNTDSVRDEMVSVSHHFVLDNSIHTPVDQLWTIFKSKCLEILDTLVVSRWTSDALVFHG